ncbi:MAG TPA: serine hydrolase [Bosea sp. (in: a-proteobacteria)]|jgi:D-alanyl-D-alanine carboxypeptidase|uniref:D-alanyl-D-alanine carboxypeptidase family protein n=1 Tax=Bosea sp. (in: a-proteobacteria) TaxID=1871050 RepID=UPI002E121EC5|nr:serine hydrolase [Bosea sp. (in: a-proteobacteria)]
MIASRFTAALVCGLALTGSAFAGTSLVIDASSGAVLSSENAGQPWHPASTTKMMTAYLALKAVREGRIGLETAIPASKRAASQPRVKVYIKAGQEVTLDNALRIMMVKSANDIAYVIAEGVGGDVETFVGMMNAEAARLGMASTRFTNPNGWHDPDQQVSARDLAILAMALMREFPDYSDYWNTSAVQLGKQVLNNTNGLVGRYPGIGGMKTGFVCASGFNVVATATRGGRTLIAVVLGSLSGTERTVKAAQLLDDGFSKWGGGYSVASLPAQGGRAYNICDDVRRKGGGVALADDADTSGPIAAQASNSLGGNESDGGRFATASAPAHAGTSVLTRTPSGRISLGPRAQTVPVPVAFGRTPGSASAPLAANAVGGSDTKVARGSAPVVTPSAPVAAGLFGTQTGGLFADRGRTASGNGAIPGATTAFAPSEPETTSQPGGPMRLQGAIQPGAASAASLRPGAAAAIKPPARPPAKPLLVKPKTEAAKSQTGQAKAGEKKPAQAAAKPVLAKPPVKTKVKAKPNDTKPNDDA